MNEIIVQLIITKMFIKCVTYLVILDMERHLIRTLPKVQW